jgi:general secretion pathway protein K
MMSEQRAKHSGCNREGFIVVAALWILGALAALASIYSIYVASAASSIAVNDDSIRAEALVSASLELTAYQVTAVRREDRPSSGRFAFRMNGANVSVDFCSEAARVDLNKASKALLAGLFSALGARPDDAEQYSDRVIGWRSAPVSGSQNKEESLYQAAGLNYGPRAAPFVHVGELTLVLGLPADMVERAMPYITVYSGRPEINAHDAPPEIIAALPGMTPERLNMVLNDRQLLAEKSSLTQLGLGPAEATTEGSKAMRVTVRMTFDSGRKIVSEAVILIDGRSEPYRVLSWQSDAEAQRTVRNVPGAGP